jgi:hypothetical protein
VRGIRYNASDVILFVWEIIMVRIPSKDPSREMLEEERHRWIDPLKKARSFRPDDWAEARRAARKVRGKCLQEAALYGFGGLICLGIGQLSGWGVEALLASSANSFLAVFGFTVGFLVCCAGIALGVLGTCACGWQAGKQFVLASHAKVLVAKVEQRVAKQAARAQTLTRARPVDLSNEPDNVMTPTAQHQPASLPEVAQPITIEMPKDGGCEVLGLDEPSRPVERSARAADEKLWPGK